VSFYNQSQEMKANETVPGVKMLRELWDIPRDSGPRETAPNNISTDIYSTRVGGPPSRRRRLYHP
jgi:hypothetical protein